MPRFLYISTSLFIAAALLGCGDDARSNVLETRTQWTTYGQNLRRTFFNAAETTITSSNVATLVPKWRYLTGAVVTASPAIAYVALAGEGSVKVVFVPSWDGNLYALRASNGSKVWSFAMKPHPGASFPQASSPSVVTISDEQRVYVGGGMTMYCLAAATGELRWQFDAGTGCTTCDSEHERNEVLSSPAVFDDKVFFGMDVDDREGGKGGAYAIDARDGHLLWFLDLESGQVCRPNRTDQIFRFDGYHSAAELGLPGDFFSTRPGCDFDRSGNGCGNIWSSFSVDQERRLIYTATINCDTDGDPNTIKPPPPMPALDEALIALSLDGTPRWSWRPREIDNADLAFGGVPNLFQATIGGQVRDVVGVGNKDGTYYLLDRDGVNANSGRIEPYWQTNVVPGGEIGGIISSAAVGDGKVFFSTAIGTDISEPQRPSAYALDADDGRVLWSDRNALQSFGPTTAVPGVAFMGGLLAFLGALNPYDAVTGERLGRFVLDGPVSSSAAIVDGEVFVGEGTGARGGSPAEVAFLQSVVPSHLNVFCLPTSPDCPATGCDDGQRCTYDFHAADGCQSEPVPDGVSCGARGEARSCRQGECLAD